MGPVYRSAPLPHDVAGSMNRAATECEFVLTWDEDLGAPDPAVIRESTKRPGDVWHAGLALGLTGQPSLIDFIRPTWPMNCDPDLSIAATSWRVSLRACLARAAVISQLGGPGHEYQSLDGASLEMGHRWIMLGALMRHVPGLAGDAKAGAIEIPLPDQVRFAVNRFGRRWTQFGLARAMMTRSCSFLEGLRSLGDARSFTRFPEPKPIDRSGELASVQLDSSARVTVIIPTVERYPYLRTVLNQLRGQTVRPHEVFVIDQTPAADRDLALEVDFADLPLRVIRLDEPGQCTARNAALTRATGTHFLFIDDDDEIEADLTEKHLRSLAARQADASCGVVEEPGALRLTPEFQRVRASDVFPAGNSLVRREALVHSGLFDLAYDRGQRADADLGMRLSQSGALRVLDGSISAFHHHAPRGGLRVHKARAITYGSSRVKLWHRHVPTVSDLYLSRRYFSDRQVREAMWMAALGTLAGRGSRGFRLVKSLVGLALMPSTVLKISRNDRLARLMFKSYPQIPALSRPATIRRHDLPQIGAL